ncbi:PAS domain-containing sensor histidine kinase, partial [Verrucomicrobiales bacterium]|nr:PAS domain-containing sensor histidine kinase [Verrucomicrobiales bacterium]
MEYVICSFDIGGNINIKGLDWDNLISGKGSTVSKDLEVFYPENRYLNFYIKLINTTPKDEELAYVMLIRDITESRKGEEEKLESERLSALTMLAAGVAHEIGNPLNSMNIHLQLLERKLKKAVPDLYEAELRDLIDTSADEVKRLDHIIDQFLKAIRPSQPQLEPTDVNELVKESMRFLEPEIKDRGINLTLELRSALPPLQLDSDQIKQAFYNVVKNASQATSPGGSITVRSDLSDEHVSIIF